MVPYFENQQPFHLHDIQQHGTPHAGESLKGISGQGFGIRSRTGDHYTMDKLNQYRQKIKQILTRYSQIKPSFGDIERYTAFDNEQDHYQVINVGWENRRRVYGCLIHIDIKGDKIWIQYDGTEDGIANELVELGIPKHDIVLAYKSLFMRKYTDFAVG